MAQRIAYFIIISRQIRDAGSKLNNNWTPDTILTRSLLIANQEIPAPHPLECLSRCPVSE
jgi:hypothetical protein